MPYATLDDLAAYLGVEVANLEPESERLLLRASEIIEYHTLGKSDNVGYLGSTELINGTCAQVEYWMNTGEALDIMGNPSSFSAGSFSMSTKLPELAPRTRRIIRTTGMLNRSVSQVRGSDL